MIPFWQDAQVSLYQGDVLEVLAALPAASINTVVTSPPYWGLRDYGSAPLTWGGDPACGHEWGEPVSQQFTAPPGSAKQASNHGSNGVNGESASCWHCGAWRGSYGLEPTPQLYVEHTVAIFRQVRRLLRKDGTLWLNLGDSYASGDRDYYYAEDRKRGNAMEGMDVKGARPQTPPGLKPKDLIGIPWRVALALQADGWWLRRDIIWAKPNPMPESAKDRPTTAHEYLFLLTQAERYYYDAAAIMEPVVGRPYDRNSVPVPSGWDVDHIDPTMRQGRYAPSAKAATTPRNDGDRWNENNGRGFKHAAAPPDGKGARMIESVAQARLEGADHDVPFGTERNKRSVWEIATVAYPGAHFATFPPDLVKPCVLAGAPEGGIVLDPFIGSGTTAWVAKNLGRRAIGIDLKADYLKLAAERCAQQTIWSLL